MKKAKFILAAMLLSTLFMYSCKKTESIVEETAKPIKPSETELFAEKSLPNSCPFVDIASQPFSFVNGAPEPNTTCVDGVNRIYSVHVPTTYDPTGNYPVVFLFHGGGQDFRAPYQQDWGWAQLVDQEDIIVISMESSTYTFLGGAVKKRWNNPWVAGQLVNPADALDDVGFVRQVYEVLEHNLAIDTDRIYASGFSNGCNFVKTRVLSELGDIFSAASGAGNLGIDPAKGFPTYVAGSPVEIATVSFFGMHGTDDANLTTACGVPQLPLDATVIVDPTYCHYPSIENMLNYMSLDASYGTYSIAPGTPLETTHISFANSTDPSLNNLYFFRVVKGLHHKYRSSYAEIFWNWMKQK